MTLSDSEIYISIDIEADGPIPGVNSMLSIGNAAFYNNKLIDTWSVNLETLSGAHPDINTKIEFWDKNPKAWKACRQNIQPIDTAIGNYIMWLVSLERQYKGKVVAVAFPAGFDFTFIYWYLMKFAKYSPFSFSCIDITTYAMSILQLPYRRCTKRQFPKEWFDLSTKHTHIAIDDAIEQGMLFINMKQYRDTSI